jgi:hypothetical protein
MTVLANVPQKKKKKKKKPGHRLSMYSSPMSKLEGQAEEGGGSGRNC